MTNMKKMSILIFVLATLSNVAVGDNGVKIVNINAPIKNKVSVNNVSEFNVKDKGTVINNIDKDSHYKTVISETISGNPNISKGNEADIALFNISGNTTQLDSTLEAASTKPLKVYIANENGIKVDGAKFINIDDLVLTTGVVYDDGNSIVVRKGNVDISDKGLNGAKKLSIYSQNLNNKGKIASNDINIILGHNYINSDKISYTYADKYLDTNNLGSIYGNDITIQSTGFTDINIDELLAKNNIDLNNKGKIVNTGKIVAGNDISIKAKDLVNKGSVKFDSNLYDQYWIDYNGNIYNKEQLEKLWKNSKTKTLTNKDTALVLTGSLLNQWFTDENYLKKASPKGGIFKRFDDTLNEFNKDNRTILIRKAKDIVENKHKKRDFVNKGDIYATEINDKKILEAVVVSKVKANQAVISGKNININIQNELLNQDGLIDADQKLKIKAKKLINRNTVSDDIKLNDGYENVSWDLNVKQKDILADYEIKYERGLVDDNASRKTKISAVNTSKLEGKQMILEVDDIKLEDSINTATAIISDDLAIHSSNISLKGQIIDAKKLNIFTDNLKLKNASITSNEAFINSKNVSLDSTKELETVIKTDKETLTKEVISSSGIYAKNKLVINTDNLNLLGSIIKSDNTLAIKANVLNNIADKTTKNYNSSYDIAKTYRKIKHNEKNERVVSSFVYAKNLVMDVKKNNTVGSYIVGVDKINYKAGSTKIDALKIKNELDRNYGVDNGILGVNYNKVKKIENEAMGSILLSKGDIKAKIDKELELVGSTIKGQKVKVEAENINIKGKEITKETTTESRNLLSGDLKGNAQIDKKNLKIAVDMEVFNKEKTNIKEKLNSKSKIEGTEVELVAKNETNVQGSDIDADKIKLKGKVVKVQNSKDETQVTKDKLKVDASNKFAINEANLESSNTLVVDKTDEKLKTQKTNASSIKGKNEVTIEAEDVLVKGSKVEGKDITINAQNKVEIKNDSNSEQYSKTGEKITMATNVKMDAKVLGIVQTLKKIVDERENLMSYAQNPVAGYQKTKEYKAMLEKNIDSFKTLIDNIKANKIDPESLGISMTTEGVIKYDQNYITSLSTQNEGSLISGQNIKINANKEIKLTGSKVKGENVEIKSEKITLENGENKKNANETNANIGLTAKHEIISQNTSGKLETSAQNKGNISSQTVSSEIEANKINIKTDELNLQNSKINAKQGSVEAKKTNINDKAEKDTKYSISANGVYDNGSKVGSGTAMAKVEHKQEVKNKSSIKVENGTVNLGDKVEKNEAKVDVNLNVQSGVNVDPDGKVKSNVKGGASTTVSKKGNKVSTTGTIGVNGGLEFEDDNITNGNLSAELKGDLTVNDIKNIEQIKIKINEILTVNKDGKINNDLNSVVDATFKTELENLKGKLKLSVQADMNANEKGIQKLDGKANANLDLEAKLKLIENIDTILKLNSNGQVNINKDALVSGQGKLNTDLNVKGQNFSSDIKLDTSIKGDSKKGITDSNTKLEGNGKLEIDKLKLDAQAEVSKKKDEKVDASANIVVNDLVKVKADNKNGISKPEIIK